MIEGFVKRVFSHRGEPSSKRVIAGFAALSLCVSLLAIIFAIVYQALKNWAIAVALVTVATLLGGYVVWMAKQFFLKPDDPENVGVEAPPAPGADSVLGPRPGSGGAQ